MMILEVLMEEGEVEGQLVQVLHDEMTQAVELVEGQEGVVVLACPTGVHVHDASLLVDP